MTYNKCNQNTIFIFRKVIFHIIMDSINSNSETKSVIDLTQEPVHTNDDKDLGDIEAINKYSIVKRGFKDVIPMKEEDIVILILIQAQELICQLCVLLVIKLNKMDNSIGRKIILLISIYNTITDNVFESVFLFSYKTIQSCNIICNYHHLIN